MNKKLDKLLRKYEKDYTIIKGSDIKVESKIRTGWYGLDYVLDGGFSQNTGGHICEFYGGESSGKTTGTLYVIKKYQESGKICAFINAENSYDPAWAKIIGVKNEDLLVIKPDTLEKAGNLLIDMIGEVDLIIIDSIVALVPASEIEKDLEQKTMGAQASVNSTMCRKINRKRGCYNTTIIFINQLREKIGQMYGNPETTGGGRAVRHLYDTRIRFKQGKPIDKGSGEKKERIGFEIDLWAKKNKKGVPYRKAVTDFYFDGKLDNNKSLFFSAVKYNIISLSGKTYIFKDKKIVGKDNMMTALTEKDYIEIEKEIWKIMK